MSEVRSARERAVDHVRALARAAQGRARERIASVLAAARANADFDLDLDLDRLASAAARARITISFHPDRLLKDGRTVAEALLADGRYKSQFETAISNGSRTAFPGGARDHWEAKLFGGAYHEPPSPAHERPKYGALDIMEHSDGGSPRFGSCYLVLRPHVNERCTFTWGDSYFGPEHVGTSDTFEPLLASMLEAAHSDRRVLAVHTSVSQLVERLDRLAPLDRHASNDAPGRALDDYIEAQVHGPIDLSSDVTALVIDPAHANTTSGLHLHELGTRHGFDVRAHHGFILATNEVPDAFRGPRMRALAERICAPASSSSPASSSPPTFDAATIGRAAASLARDPSAWADWDTPDETLQHLKQLWHVLVHVGRPRAPHK